MNAISHADAVQCDNCRQAISSLGGEYSSPTTLPTHFTNHADHISYALRDKSYTHTTLFPPAIEQALKDNNRYVARMLTWCHASDTKQIFLLQQFISQDVTHARYRVCPVCGNISWEPISPRHCPHCMTDSVRFVVFAFPKIQ
jgi:rubrerythrin